MAIRWIGAAAHAAVRLLKHKSGVSAAELAMVMPVFTLMIAGVMQYGVLFYIYNVALNGARSAARAMAVGSADQARAESIMRDSLPIWVTGSRGGATIAFDCERDDGRRRQRSGSAADGCAQASRGGADSGNDGNGILLITATDAIAGAEVRTRMVIPSVRATVLPMAPMPEYLTVSVHMVKEG